MSQPDTPSPNPAHDVDHTHADVSGGWLRAATFGAMDGLVSNTALIAGVAAAASARAVVLSGVAGLLAGAFSMALGEYYLGDDGQRTDRLRGPGGTPGLADPPARRARRAGQHADGHGHDRGTAATATEEIHRDENRAVNFHLVQEIGVDPEREAVAPGGRAASFLMFAIGAIIPLIPYLLGYESLWLGLACGAVGLLVAGGWPPGTPASRCGGRRGGS